MMAVWVKALQGQVPQVRLAIFLDDRSLWSVGRNAVSEVVQAMRAAQPIDAMLGLGVHGNKLESFATTQPAREALFEAADVVGTPQDTFRLLGVTYHMREDACTGATKLTEVMRRRARRITMAARSVSLRIALLTSLVVALFSWLGPWQRFTQTVMLEWARIIEHAVWGGPPSKGRSRALFWIAVASPGLHPAFALALAAVMWEWRRETRPHALHASCRGPRAAQAFELLGWRAGRHGWDTPFGLIRPGWISLRHVRWLAAQSWARVMWQDDTKVVQPLPDGFHPDFSVARRLAISGADRYLMRVVTGAAVDGRLLHRLNLQDTCACGAAQFDRRHATFDCPAAPWLLARRSADERRMLCPLLPLPSRQAVCPPRPDPALIAHLQSLQERDGPVLLAIDGSCLVSAVATVHQRASWGVASVEGFKVAGIVQDLEHTPAAGERAALWQAVAAAQAAGLRALRLCCDNEAVVKRLQRGFRGSWEGDCRAFWASIASMLPSDTDILWVPSRGKHQHWTPPPTWPSATLCRLYNQWADEAAGQITAGEREGFEQMVALIHEGRCWAETATMQQGKTTRTAMSAVRALYAQDFAREMVAISPFQGGDPSIAVLDAAAV